jgi:hypothetical protein
MPLIKRQEKGSKLTIEEMDGNLDYFQSSDVSIEAQLSSEIEALAEVDNVTIELNIQTNEIRVKEGLYRPYSLYVALLNQTGTNSPSDTILENTLGTVLTFNRTSAGVYEIINSDGWDFSKTWFAIPGLGNQGGLSVNPGRVVIGYSGSSLYITCYGNDYVSSIDDQLVNTPIEIRIYN